MSTTIPGPDSSAQDTDTITDPTKIKEKIVAKVSQYLVTNFLTALNILHNLALSSLGLYMYALDPDSSTSW